MRRAARVALTAATLTTLLTATLGPAQAHAGLDVDRWLGPLPRTVTSGPADRPTGRFEVQGHGDDWTTLGRSYTGTHDTMWLSLQGGARGLVLDAQDAEGSWWLIVSAPAGEDLVVGRTYPVTDGPQGSPPDGAGLMLGGQGRGCHARPRVSTVTINALRLTPEGYAAHADVSVHHVCDTANRAGSSDWRFVVTAPLPLRVGVDTRLVSDARGDRRVEYAVTCSRASYVSVESALRQGEARDLRWVSNLACRPGHVVRALADGVVGAPFGPGPVEARTSASADDRVYPWLLLLERTDVLAPAQTRPAARPAGARHRVVQGPVLRRTAS